MLFCPTCANLLVISAETGINKWACNSCPYEFPITKQMTSRTKLKRKEVDDVLGGEAMWAHADQTQASCPKCNHNAAYFYQLQIRSADEPMTTYAFNVPTSGGRTDGTAYRSTPNTAIYEVLCELEGNYLANAGKTSVGGGLAIDSSGYSANAVSRSQIVPRNGSLSIRKVLIPAQQLAYSTSNFNSIRTRLGRPRCLSLACSPPQIHPSASQKRNLSTLTRRKGQFDKNGVVEPASPFSVNRQTAAESEWLQDDSDDAATIDVLEGPPLRYDWRGRAPSRVKKVKTNQGQAEARGYRKRIRPPTLGYDLSNPLVLAAQAYSERFMRLLALEEAEDEAALRHRLTTWSLDRLKLEGYCLTDLSAYWLQENQFGKPVASFIVGPGENLPAHKFENGAQVMISRLDPLREAPAIGSVLSHTKSAIRVCFPTRFDLNEGVWRLDLGRPNLMYERMRQAISHLMTKLEDIEALETKSSWQYILQGTHLRDIILRSFIPLSLPESDFSPSDDVESEEKDSGPMFGHGGVFKDDQRIQSWARRYSRPDPVVVEGDPLLDGLNQSQIRAIAAMIGERVSLIQGPPGTGKSKTIIETIKLLKIHFEVPHPLLVCTYTNVAVDNLVEGFASVGVKPLRIGYNGNVRQSCLPYSLDYKLEQHPLHPALTTIVKEEAEVASQIRELENASEELDKKIEDSKRPRKATLERARNMKEALLKWLFRHKAMKRKIYAMQQQMLRDVVADADVICTTCITAACNALNVIDFPVVFVDEASMSTEPASLIPIMKGSRHLALIGDHKQLPPVIVSKKAKEEGLGISLFERLTEEGYVPSVMLDIQYRMHPDISHFPAMEFYNLALLDGTVDSVGNALPGLEPPSSMHLRHDTVKNRSPSVIFLDHTGNESFKGRSRVNITEAHIVASVVEDLLLNNPHLKGRDIGIIAPYAAQVNLLMRLLNTDPTYKKRFHDVLGDHRAMHLAQIEIKTVDGFEGREKEVIVFSTVRNNSAGHIGFLADKKRLNVGLTRAKRGLFVVGSIATLRAGKFSGGAGEHAIVRVGKGAESWRRYAEYLTKRNLVISLTGRELEGALYGHLTRKTLVIER